MNEINHVFRLILPSSLLDAVYVDDIFYVRRVDARLGSLNRQ